MTLEFKTGVCLLGWLKSTEFTFLLYCIVSDGKPSTILFNNVFRMTPRISESFSEESSSKDANLAPFVVKNAELKVFWFVYRTEENFLHRGWLIRRSSPIESASNALQALANSPSDVPSSLRPFDFSRTVTGISH